MSSFTTGDTAPAFTATILSDGVPVNLAGAAVSLHLRPPSGIVLIVGAAIVSGPAGTITYQWVPGNLAEFGQWTWEVQVTYSDGRIQTFPGAPFDVDDDIS